MKTPTFFPNIVAAVTPVALAALACSSGGNLTGAGGGQTGGSPGYGAATTVPLGVGGAGPGAVIVLPDASANSGGSFGTSGYDAVVACTDGDDCICPTLNVAVVGTRGQW